MNSSQPALKPVFKLFLLLFSDRWIRQWQRQRPGPKASCKPKRQQAPGPRQPASRPGWYERIFSLRVTLWFLIFQRLSFDISLAGVVRSLRNGEADGLCPRGRKLSKRVKSNSTSAYNQARQRLPLEFLLGAWAQLSQWIVQLVGCMESSRTKPPLAQRVRQLLDGSTLALLATAALRRAFRPARGQTDWCLMRIVVGFCARSGAVLNAVEGAITQSEQRLTWGLMAAAAPFIIWIGDRNFGIWSVVAHAVRYRQDVVVRMTRARANKLAAGRPLVCGEDRPVRWQPSRHDQGAQGTERTATAGRLIYVRLKRGHHWIDLWLFTTLSSQEATVQLLVQWYGHRWQAELHFRSIKTQMRLSQLDVCTPEMARKEFYAALLAYSLVRAILWAAGERLESGRQILSFSDARRVLLDWLETWGRQMGRISARAPQWIKTLLAEVARQRLPKRKKLRRSQIRMVRRRASKWPILKGSRAAAEKRLAINSKSS